MKRTLLAAALAAALVPTLAQAASPIAAINKLWSFSHAGNPGQSSEIAAFDAATNSIWVAGVAGVDVLNAGNGSLIQHIDVTAFGSVNSVAIKNGVAAFAIENTADRTLPGTVQFYDTTSRANTGSVSVGALPDMLTFTPDGSKLLVANEGTPTVYGPRLADSDGHRNYGPSPNDPVGSVSIIDMASRSVVATPNFAGAQQFGSHIRSNTGMDFEPEYIAVSGDGSKAFVGLQEANAMGVIDLASNTTVKVVGLGVKDFNGVSNAGRPDQVSNAIDPKNDGSVNFSSVAAKGLYMPDGMASYEAGGNTFVIMANEGDFREDDADRSAASSFGRTAPLDALRVSNTDSSASGDIFAAGGRSFSIRDVDGNLVYDSGNLLDTMAAAKGLYDDGRSRDKGVEAEGVTILELGGRTLALVGLERTLESAVAIFDVTNPYNVSYLDMIVGGDGDGIFETGEDRSPEGLLAYSYGGNYYLAVAHEVSNTTTLYSLTPVPEPETYAFMAVGLGLVGLMVRRRKA